MGKDNARGDGVAAGKVARRGVDKDAIQKAVLTILRAIGEDAEREGLLGTPRRIANMYEELFSGLGEDPIALLTIRFESKHKQTVIVKDLPMDPLRDHHL